MRAYYVYLAPECHGHGCHCTARVEWSPHQDPRSGSQQVCRSANLTIHLNSEKYTLWQMNGSITVSFATWIIVCICQKVWGTSLLSLIIIHAIKTVYSWRDRVIVRFPNHSIVGKLPHFSLDAESNLKSPTFHRRMNMEVNKGVSGRGGDSLLNLLHA